MRCRESCRVRLYLVLDLSQASVFHDAKNSVPSSHMLCKLFLLEIELYKLQNLITVEGALPHKNPNHKVVECTSILFVSADCAQLIARGKSL